VGPIAQCNSARATSDSYRRSGRAGSSRNLDGQVRIQGVCDPSQDWQCRNRAPSLEARHSRLRHPSRRRELSLTPPA
jgi:hypothetical protein